MASVLEFPGGQREPFLIDGGELYIGRGASCGLRLESAAAERHARVTVDGGGNVFIQDLDTHTGTLRNGDFVYGVQQLDEGDKIEIGGMALVFRRKAPVIAVAPPAPLRAGAEDRTRMPTEVPPEVRAALAARQSQSQPQPPPPIEAAPAGIIVGTPEPEPDNFRTVQMAPADLAALGIDPASLPQVKRPAATTAPPTPTAPPAAPAAVPPKRTILGMAAPVIPKPAAPPATASAIGYAATAELQAQRTPTVPPTQPKTPMQQDAPRAPAPQRTMMGIPAPIVSPSPPLAPSARSVAPSAPAKPVTPSAPAKPVTPSAPAHATAPTMMAQAPQTAPTMMAQAPQTAPTMMAQAPQTAPTMMAQALPSMKTAPLMEAPVLPAASAAPLPPLAPAPQPTPISAAPGKPSAPRLPVAQPYTAPAKAYTPSPKGPFGSFSRALAFMGQIFALASQHKALLKPLLWDVLLTTPIMAAFTVLEFFVHSRNGFYAAMALEAFLLYFVDYACNAITASLMYDYATSGDASMQTAIPRVRKALPGVLTFAAVSALFDVAATYARERNDVASRLILRLLRAVWSTATYVIMPALVIEGVSFGDALKRSKQLMDKDPTGVGAGIVAMSITSYLIAAVCFPLSYLLLHLGAHLHPAIGALLAMLLVNLYWAVSGWMKIAYSTCFYLWARECERTGTQDHALAPLPLRTALDAA